MKSLQLSLVSLGSLLGLVGACATSSQDNSVDPGYDAGGHDSSSKYDANPPKKEGGGGGTCPAMCTTDNDCQSGCSAGQLCTSGMCQVATTGVSCCDLLSGVCYIEGQQCPAPNDGGVE